MSQSSSRPDAIHTQAGDGPDATTRSGPTLWRVLGPGTAIAVVVGNVIGSGIFLKPGTIAGQGGQFGLIIGVWAAGGVLCLLGALCFAELAAMLPHAGGLYVYLREAYGRPVAFTYGLSEFLFGRPAGIGALAVAFLGALAVAADWQLTDTAQCLLATGFIVALAWVNILGALWGGRLQVFFTVIKAGFLALVALLPFLLTPFISGGVLVENYRTAVEPSDAALGVRVGAVLLAVMWAYNGWYGVTPLAEEIRNPQRNIPWAMFGGIGILMVLYIGANFAYHGVLSMQEMKAADEDAAQRMLQKLLGQPGLVAMSAVIMCSTFGAINTNLLQCPRITFAMGRDGVFFRDLGRVHANYRTPAVAIAVTAIMSILLIAAVAAGKWMAADVVVADLPLQLLRKIVTNLKEGTIFTLLTNFVIFSISVFYTLGVLAVIVLRRKHPDWNRPYRTWGYPVVPALYITVYVWFLLMVYKTNPLESLTGIGLILLGLPVYWAYRWHVRRAAATESG